jgi:hypothetical protein
MLLTMAYLLNSMPIRPWKHEMIGWMALGFIPTYGALEIVTHKLAKRMSARLFLNLDSKSKGRTKMKIRGL